MNVVILGPSIEHTLIGLTRECVRRPTVEEAEYKGGVHLLKSLLGKVARDNLRLDDIHVLPIGKTVRTFAECRRYPGSSKDTDKEVWRIDKILGETVISGTFKADLGNEIPDLLILEVPYLVSDSGVDISPVESPIIGVLADNAWVIVKTEAPKYLGSPLFESINLLAKSRQIVVTSLNTVRRRDKTLLAGALSWEGMADAIRAELNRQLGQDQGTASCSLKYLPTAVVVSMLNDGAAYYYCNNSKALLTLLYDPKSIGGEWMSSRPGRVPGHTQCITVAIAAALAAKPPSLPLGQYIQAGIQGGRMLHELGYAPGEKNAFPVEQVGQHIIDASPGHIDPKAMLPSLTISADQDEVNWSILRRVFLQNEIDPTAPILGWPDVRDRLLGVVKEGFADHFKDVPAVRFGDLTAVLREEIEGLRTIRGLMREYAARPSNKRPLSIAVFGAPGSGKSFGVKAVAKSIPHRRGFETVEFNLSQFSAPEQLYSALHQVRDTALSGKMPLVFWDEFDCEFSGPYGWLRYFLAPMQDGKFTEGQTTHSVGNAVFVFAGGTSENFEDFRASAGKAVTAKGPDFLSRLHGYFNVSGLNHERLSRSDSDAVLLGGVLIRRAILLRKFLEDYATGIAGGGLSKVFDVDDSIITAFLCINKFRYGARSMEALISMSALDERNRFERSCLPPIEQTELHVESSEWLALLEDRSNVLKNGTFDNPRISW